MALAALTGCSRDEVPAGNRGGITVFTASVESSDDTRTGLGTKEGDSYPTLWRAGDAIALTDGTDTGKYTTQDDGKETADFTFVSGAEVKSAESVYGYYPYEGLESCTDGTFRVTFPAVQNYMPGNIDNGTYAMVAVSADNTLRFRNVCGIVRLSLASNLTDLHVKSVTVTAGSSLSGAASVNYNGSTDPEVVCTGRGQVTLSCGEGVALSADAVDFYIVLPSNEAGYENLAFKVDFTDGRIQTFTANTPVRVERSAITAVSLTADHPVIPTRATIKNGREFNADIKTLAAGYKKTGSDTDTLVKTIRFVVKDAAPKQDGETEVQDADSGYPIYIGWDPATATITVRTEADAIRAPQNATNMFYDFDALTTFDWTGFDTSQTTDMSYMLGSCQGLKNLDLTAFDTSNVTTMVQMVYSAYSLISVDLSSFDTSKVMDFQNMFNGSPLLSSVNLGPRFVFPEGANIFGIFNNTFTRVKNPTITCTASCKAALLEERTFDASIPYEWNIVE